MDDGVTYINQQPETIKSAFLAYQSSNTRIATLEGAKNTGSDLTWRDLESAIKSANQDKKLTDEEINRYKQYWQASGLEQDVSIKNVSEALVKLATWSRNKRDDAKRALTTCYSDDAKEQEEARAQYRKTLDAYIAGNASEAELKSAAEKAFGKAAASRKVHLSRLEGVYEDNLEGLTTSSSRYQAEYNQLGQELADLVGQTWKARLEAELAAREVEWNQQRQDLAEKRSSWREAAGLIMERGRADWKAGLERMRDSYTNWKQGFNAAYEEGSLAWDTAYLSGLKEKEAWAERATATAMEASSEAMLALVGSDAEAGARSFDTLALVPSLESGAESARAEMEEVLNLAGITNLGRALEASIGSAETAAREVRTGLGGLGLWDSGKAQVAATSFTRKANQELASRQARLLAAQARDMAQAAIKGLEEQVQSANNNFREGMDDTFVLKGSWRKEGQNYSKDVVVYSTLMDPVVTERASVEGYKAYIMKPVNLSTDLSDNKLEGLEANAIQVLIKNAQDEVKKESETIFGSEEDNSEEAKEKRRVTKTVEKKKQVANDLWTMITTFKASKEVVEETKEESREWGAGEFGRYIGYEPILQGNPNIDDGIEGIWVDKGMGELGRLMRSYIYWSIRESQGWATVNKPMWDKPAWDDRSKDGLKAPTIRGLTDIGVTIAATVVSGGATLPALLANAALNLTDDAVFAMLDVGGGYKSWEEAGLDFGKKALSSAVNIGVGGVFNGFGGIKTGFFAQGGGLTGLVSSKVGTGTLGVIATSPMGGLQTLATSTLNSAVNAFNLTYDKDGNITGLGWSADSFNAGVQGGLVSAATGMTSSLTSGLLNNWNAGENLLGFSQTNQRDVYNLNNTLGSLAGQGVNFALTGDFALNVLNMSDLTGGKLKNGLLELHLGKNGATMNIGMGGADVSLGTIASAMGGLAVVDVNRRIGTYVKQSGKDLAVLLRSQYGFGDAVQKGQLWEILAGDTLIAEGGVDKENAAAQTKREGDKRVVHLAGYRDGMSKAEQLALGITLAHEAYRNGLDDGAEGQRLETNAAVEGHIAFAAALAKTYGMGAIGETMAQEVAAYTKAQSGDRSELETILSDYDASKDYWRLKTDGTIVWDGSKDLNVEYYDENGTLRIKEGHIKDSTGSYSQSLALYIGEERATQLLKSNLNNADLYDKQTIMDCLGVSAAEAASIQRSGIIPQYISENQKNRLFGEALMKASGMTWDEIKGWCGGNSFTPLTMSDIKDIGQIVINQNSDGSFDRFAISGVINRDERSYQSVRKQDGVNSYQGLDTMTLYKKNLNGLVIDSFFTSGWQTVSNGYANDFSGPTTKKAFDTGDVYRGSTIAANNYFSMRIGNFSHPDYDGTIFVLNNAKLLNSISIGLDGGEPWRNLAHSYSKGGVAKSSYGMISAGCFIADAQTLNSIQNYMNATWKVNYPYDVLMVVRNGRNGR